MESTNKIEYHIRDLGTRSVTLFPTKAHVFRDVQNVALRPGTNEITISGLSPTVDEKSIKVEGSGSAIISDIAVENLTTLESFEDVYSGSDDDDQSEDEDHAEARESDDSQLEQLHETLARLEDEQRRADEAEANALSRKRFLDDYARTLTREHEHSVDKTLQAYKKERQSAFDDEMEANQLQRKLRPAIEQARGELDRAQRRRDKAIAKASKEAKKETNAKEKRRRERRFKRDRVRQERIAFWPKYCYSVRIVIEATAATPTSSRPASIASEAELIKTSPVNPAYPAAVNDDDFTCDLVLSYVTSSAHWAPSYDLQLSSTAATAKLSFDARLHNATSETWKNCKITLSTSQMTFSGSDDSIPVLLPWRIRLIRDGAPSAPSSGILQSSQEQREWLHKLNHVDGGQKSREEMFGLPRVPSPQFGTQAQPLRRSSNLGPVLCAKMKLKAMPLATMSRGRLAKPASSDDSDQDNEVARATLYGDGATLREPVQDLAFQESLVEEQGLTTTYDLPGHKTLEPSFTASKQRVVCVNFPHVQYSHTIVPKCKPAAYLKAKLRNSSGLTLLSGEAGLTVDGSFMGRTRLPRCSAGDTIDLSLGVDPAVKVTYPKPTVRRSTTGTFTKGSNSVYTRLVTVHNTRASAGKSIQVQVQDQIPVSEDERLGVSPLMPMGLSTTGMPVKAGAPARGEADKDWGTAEAVLKKGGLVNWNVKLNAGKAVNLSLEYLVSMQSGQLAVEC